jgi:glutaredoxin-like YruB-family protein
VAETKKQPRVVLFATPTCSWCRRAKQYFKQNRIRFKEVDVSRDQRAAKDMQRMTGQMGVPVILIGSNKPIVGFDKSTIDRLLNIRAA